MKWIKASERLPDKTGLYFCKIKYCHTPENEISKAAVQYDTPFWKLYEENYIVEWLDEQPIPQDDYWKKRCEAAEKILEHLHVTQKQVPPLSLEFSLIKAWDKLKSDPFYTTIVQSSVYADRNGLHIYDGDEVKLGYAEATGTVKYENGTFWIYHLGIKRHISDYEQSGIRVIKSNIIK